MGFDAGGDGVAAERGTGLIGVVSLVDEHPDRPVDVDASASPVSLETRGQAEGQRRGRSTLPVTGIITMLPVALWTFRRGAA